MILTLSRMLMALSALIVVGVAVHGDLKLIYFIQGLKRNESLASQEVQRRVRAAFGHEVVWKTFFRHPITEHVYRSLTIPIADAIYTRVNADQVTALGVVVALISFPFLKSKRACYRWIGFWIMLLRELIDCTDGEVALARREAHLDDKKSSSSSSSSSSTASYSRGYAYFLDGFADGTVTLIFLFICHLRWKPRVPFKDCIDSTNGGVIFTKKHQEEAQSKEIPGKADENQDNDDDDDDDDDDANEDDLDQAGSNVSHRKPLLKDVERQEAILYADTTSSPPNSLSITSSSSTSLLTSPLSSPPRSSNGRTKPHLFKTSRSLSLEEYQGRFGSQYHRIISSSRLLRDVLFPPHRRHLLTLLEYFVTFCLQCYCYNSTLARYVKWMKQTDAAERNPSPDTLSRGLLQSMSYSTGSASLKTTELLQSATFGILLHLWNIYDPSNYFPIVIFFLSARKEFEFCRFASRRIAVFAFILYFVTRVHLHYLGNQS